MRRRTILGGLSAAVAAGLVTAGWWKIRDFDFRDGLQNPCRRPQLPRELANHPLLAQAWQGLDTAQVWDSHCHLIGLGDAGSGIHVLPELMSPLHPAEYLRFRFFMNAACANAGGDAGGVVERAVDMEVVRHLLALLDAQPTGVKAMLLAFDYAHDHKGRALRAQSSFYVPNHWAASVAHAHHSRIEWIASIHPYRSDAVDALQQASEQGARAIKWLPSAMNIDPSSSQCDRFYQAMAELDLPLISHAGEEQAVAGAGRHDVGNPLLLRRALDTGVRVIVAHCASLGDAVDLDRPDRRRVPAFELFTRMMDAKQYRGRLFGDIAAVTQANRSAGMLKTLLDRRDWQGRLINGSDYPLPGVLPLFNVDKWVDAGLLSVDSARVLRELRLYNPLLFDFVLKRSLRWKGKGFANAVFETRKHFVEP